MAKLALSDFSFLIAVSSLNCAHKFNSLTIWFQLDCRRDSYIYFNDVCAKIYLIEGSQYFLA